MMMRSSLLASEKKMVPLAQPNSAAVRKPKRQVLRCSVLEEMCNVGFDF